MVDKIEMLTWGICVQMSAFTCFHMQVQWSTYTIQGKGKSEDFSWMYSENTAGLKQGNEVTEFLSGRLLLLLMEHGLEAGKSEGEGNSEEALKT